MTGWLIAFVIALILIKAARREEDSTKNFAWTSKEVAQSKTWAYAMAIASLFFILAAVVLFK